MRTQPLENATNSTSTKSMDNGGVKLPPLNPLSQIDCLAPERADEKAVLREHELNLAKIRHRQKRIIKSERKEREFEFVRKRKRFVPNLPEGSYPPLSQVPMGNSPIIDVPITKKSHHMYKRNINTTKLIPISQISCLMDKDNRTTPPKATSKIHDYDSKYVKLAKSGGQQNLLHYIEAKPPLQRSIDDNYSPSGLLPELKTKSVQDPSWKPSQWREALSPIKKDDKRDNTKLP